MIKVILAKDVDNLGREGDIVSVKEGFARNFLIPQELAQVPTPANIKAQEALRAKSAQRLIKEKKRAEEVSAAIAAKSFTVARRAGEDDILFGSVTGKDIAEAISQEGFAVDKRQVELDEPIKELGLYTVALRLHPEVVANVKLWVVREG